MKKACFTSLFTILLLVSCVTPFGERNPVISRFNTRNGVLATFKQEGVVSRISVVLKEDEFFGVIEGNFSKTRAKKFISESDLSAFGYDRLAEKYGEIYFSFPANGLVFFSNEKSDGPDLREGSFDMELSRELMSGKYGFFTENLSLLPAETGAADLPGDKINFILVSESEGKSIVRFSVTDKKDSDALLKFLKADYVKNLKLSGQKIDVEELKDVIFQSGLDVYFVSDSLFGGVLQNGK
ncbi:MAG: hypothetical protein MJ052_02770 [Sphaerochaetaceae bacterium]|nr:hypothetical protein [Sphaerochaetaceae bacterium]